MMSGIASNFLVRYLLGICNRNLKNMIEVVWVSWWETTMFSFCHTNSCFANSTIFLSKLSAFNNEVHEICPCLTPPLFGHTTICASILSSETLPNIKYSWRSIAIRRWKYEDHCLIVGGSQPQLAFFGPFSQTPSLQFKLAITHLAHEFTDQIKDLSESTLFFFCKIGCTTGHQYMHIILSVYRLINKEETKYWVTCDPDYSCGGKSLICIHLMTWWWGFFQINIITIYQGITQFTNTFVFYIHTYYVSWGMRGNSSVTRTRYKNEKVEYYVKIKTP